MIITENNMQRAKASLIIHAIENTTLNIIFNASDYTRNVSE